MTQATADLSNTSTGNPPGPGGRTIGHWFIQALPFLLLAFLAVAGMSWTSLVGRPSRNYWVIFVPVAAVICMMAGWRMCLNQSERIRLIVTQALQWAAVWVAMYLIMVSDVAGLLNDDAIGLMFLVVIALGVWVSGLHERVWQLCVLGVFLAVSVPVIAFVERGAVIMLGTAVLLAILGFCAWWVRQRA